MLNLVIYFISFILAGAIYPTADGSKLFWVVAVVCIINYTYGYFMGIFKN